jgi:hypothetical protein
MAMNIQDENKAVATRGVAPDAKQLAQGITDSSNNGAVRKTTGQVINHQPVTSSTPMRKPVLPNNKKLGGGILVNPVKAMKARRDRSNPMFKQWNAEDDKSFETGFNGK